jgi:Tfp pilus assembly protein FimT
MTMERLGHWRRGDLLPRPEGKGGLALRSSTSKAGFTLLELVLTIAIVIVLGLLIGPRLINAYPRVTLESEAIRLRTDLGYAQQLAISRNRTHRVSFDAVQDVVSIYRVESAESAVLVSERTLAGRIDLVRSSFTLGYVEFNCLGEPSEGGAVELQAADGSTMTVSVTPGTGLATLE